MANSNPIGLSTPQPATSPMADLSKTMREAALKRQQQQTYTPTSGLVLPSNLSPSPQPTPLSMPPPSPAPTTNNQPIPADTLQTVEQVPTKKQDQEPAPKTQLAGALNQQKKEPPAEPVEDGIEKAASTSNKKVMSESPPKSKVGSKKSATDQVSSKRSAKPGAESLEKKEASDTPDKIKPKKIVKKKKPAPVEGEPSSKEQSNYHESDALISDRFEKPDKPQQPIIQQLPPLAETPRSVKPPKNKKIEFKCKKSGLHQDELLNIVCIEPGCGGQLCCNLCVQQSHQEHRVKPLKWLVSANEKAMSPSTEEHDSSRTELNKAAQQAKARIEKVSSQAKDAFQSFMHPTEKLLRKLKNKIQSYGLRSPASNEPAQQYHPQTQQEMREYAYEVLCRYQVNNLPHQTSTAESTLEVEMLEKEVTSVLEGFEQHIKEYELEDKLKEILSRTTFQQRFGQLRHPEMLLAGPSTVRFTGDENDFKIAIIEPEIKPGQSTYKFTLQGGEWACFGVCQLSIVRDYEYVFKHDKTGHGVYGMSASGKIYSHANSSENYTDKVFSRSTQGFKFDKSDTIVMRIDTTARKIKFSTDGRSNTKKATISYEQADLQEPIYVCVMLSRAGSRVTYRGSS